MSNYTYTRTRTISNTEYNRLQREAQESASLRNNNAALQNTARQLQNSLQQATRRADAMERQFRNTSEQISQMQQHHNAEVQNIRTQMSEVYLDMARKYQDTKNDLDQMSRDIMQATTEQIRANNQIVQEQLRQTRESINGQIEQMREQTENQYNQLNERIEQITNDVNEEREAAQEYFNEATAIRQQIEGMRPEFLLPGEVSEVDNRLETAGNDIDRAQKLNTHVAVAYGSARQAFFDAIHFMGRLIDAEQERQRQLVLTQALSQQVGAQIENSRTLSRYRLDTDYWSSGDFQRKEQEYIRINENMRDPDQLNITNLRNLQEAFREVSTAVDDCVAGALINMRTSYNVTELAQKINERLALQNMGVTAHAFEGDDKRGKYRFVLRNPGNGLTVVITISALQDKMDGLEVEADIIDYGTMSAMDAERLVRDVVNQITGNFTVVDSTCQGAGGTFVHHNVQNDPDLQEWKNPSVDHAHNASQNSNENTFGQSH